MLGRGYQIITTVERLNSVASVLRSGMAKASRKIVAILAADVVGYSRLMGLDDEGTLSALKATRAIFDRLVSEFDGRKTRINGILSATPKPVMALSRRGKRRPTGGRRGLMGAGRQAGA